jgi:hypothetical protein
MGDNFRVEEFAENYFRYRTENPCETIPRFLKSLNDAGADIVTVSEIPQSLEQVYLKPGENA